VVLWRSELEATGREMAGASVNKALAVRNSTSLADAMVRLSSACSGSIGGSWRTIVDLPWSYDNTSCGTLSAASYCRPTLKANWWPLPPEMRVEAPCEFVVAFLVD
jgi:hypothetical protein